MNYNITYKYFLLNISLKYKKYIRDYIQLVFNIMFILFEIYYILFLENS